MRFGLLGPLEVTDDEGNRVDLGGTQVRVVVAALLVAGGRVLSADSLIDVLWGDEPPVSATGTLQSYVSRLRRRFGDAAPLLWEPPGYRLAVEPGAVDHHRFEALADQGRHLLAAGRFEEAAAVLRDADRLWRGPALVEFSDRPFASGLAVRLEERRLAAVEDRVAAELAVGRHGALVGELSELVAAHPLREGLRGSLALALYRSGRQAEALRALSEARAVLRDELGVDPGHELRALESAILAQDRALDRQVPAPGPVPAPALAGPRAGAGGGSRPAAGATGAAGEGLVGREAELAQLRAALAEAAAATRAVVVEGEPGIGKTRLVEEAAAEAAAQGFLTLWGRAFEGGAAPAFWPWLEPLRALAGRLASEPGGVPPEVATLLSPSAPGPAGAPGAAPGSGEQARFILLERVAGMLAAAASIQPLMLVVDDVQWADDASLELLALVAGRLTEVPLLLVCTVRELEVGRNDAVVDALAALSRQPSTRRLRLRGLALDSTAELVERTTGAPLGQELARVIHDRAEGNPFFAIELARLLVSGGEAGATGAPGDVPSGVRDVVRRRLGLLPEATQGMLEVAGVIGRDVDLALLAAAAGRSLDECLDALDPAVVHRLLVPVPDRPGAYRFAHALVREVVVDDVSSLKRARLHLRVAEALEDTDDTAEILAEHLWAAAPIGAGRRAAAALERAARVAVRRLAYGSARHLLERAVPLRRSVGSSPADLEAELEAVALLVSVVATQDGYASLPGTPLLARGKHLAEQTGRTDEVLHLLWAEWAGLDVACEAVRAQPIADELLALSRGSDDPMASVLGDTAYGISCWHRGDLTRASAHLDAARAAAARVAAEGTELLFDVDQLRLSSPFSVYLHDLLGDLDDPERRYDEVVREVPGDRFWELLVMNFAASGALATGDYERAERAARRGLAADPEGMSAFWSMAQRAYLGVALCLQGRLEEGLPMLDDAWARYLAMGLRTNATSWLAARAQALADAGRAEEAAASLEQAERFLRETAEGYAEPLLLLARGAALRAGGGDEGAVRDRLAEALALATAQGGHGIGRRIRATAAAYGIEL